jgi:hypothetical protein
MIERSGILPTFAEGEVEFADCRSPNLKLNVVPGRAMTVPGVQLDGLSVSVVAGVISSTMTQIDTADERNVTIGSRRVADEDHLLVVRSATAYSLIEEHFTARCRHFNSEASILFRIESEAIAV